ncbi:MAG: helix-turn-helix domain-containing protein [Candidatus Methanosuratincola sp.]
MSKARAKPSYYAIIPASVRHCQALSPNAKLLYAEIAALSNRDGYCFATNRYFSTLYGVSPQSISSWIAQLRREGFIKVIIDGSSGNARRIYPAETPQRKPEGVLKKRRRGLQEGAMDNTKDNSKTNTHAPSPLPSPSEDKEGAIGKETTKGAWDEGFTEALRRDLRAAIYRKRLLEVYDNLSDVKTFPEVVEEAAERASKDIAINRSASLRTCKTKLDPMLTARYVREAFPYDDFKDTLPDNIRRALFASKIEHITVDTVLKELAEKPDLPLLWNKRD